MTADALINRNYEKKKKKLGTKTVKIKIKKRIKTRINTCFSFNSKS